MKYCYRVNVGSDTDEWFNNYMSDVRVIGDTWGRNLLILLLIMAALLPLQNNVLPRILPLADAWPDWTFLLGLLLLGFYLWVFFKQRVVLDARAVSISLLLTALIFLAALVAIEQSDPFAWYRFVVLIWFVPLLALYTQNASWRLLFVTGLVAVLLLQAQWAIVQLVKGRT